MKKILALCGYPTAGKDEIAKVLVGKFGYERVAFADPLRGTLLALDPFVAFSIYGGKRLSEVIQERGWTEAKLLPEVRQLLQRVGTEAGRDIHGQDVWVNAAKRKIEASNKSCVVITDLRFENEVAMVRRMAGTIIHVTAPWAVRINNHQSEQLDYASICDGTIHNNGTLQDLRDTVVEFINGVLA